MSTATRRDRSRGSEREALSALLGEVFAGRYRLLEPLGLDGGSRVFRARDDILARDVAVKVFRADPRDASDPPRRLAAAHVLTGLDHPSLVTLYDAHLGRDGRGFLVMELIKGPTLRQHLDQDGPLPSDAAAGVLRDIARGLATVHEAGIVHQRLRSSNTLLRPLRDGSRPFAAVLSDFGVTDLLERAARADGLDLTVDTAEYLPPERVHGEGARPASDIYSLGLLMLEALTAERPLSGGLVQDLLLDPLAYDPEIPTTFGYGWELLLTAMTARDPDARPTASEVAALAAELHDLPEPTPAAVITTDSPEPVPALRAVRQTRDVVARKRRPALWTWVTHYH
ncbi:serine/threonine-protein kinase [Microbacterium testaceum]|uniref:serine/threonine-protein kinase n=1 Tax=Microbacterium testaceum TaxID=2033 RepID=UPI00073454F5|nr:serine/threonine-protein kinase [Microbacterium testaceum]